jgi:hypothetical protein
MKTSGKFTLFMLILGIVSAGLAQVAGQFALDRARGVAEQAPAGVNPQDFARFEQGSQFMMGQDTTPAAAPEIRMIPVVEGEMVISAKSGEVLQKPEKKNVPETMKDQYYDDGTHGDEVAGDGIYSNVVVRKDVISQQEYKQRVALEALINRISDDRAVDFFRVYIAADTPNPKLQSTQYWRSKKNDFIEDYKNRVLAPYKDEKGEFYPVYEPPKPKYNYNTMMGQPGSGSEMQNVSLPTAVQGRMEGMGDVGPMTGSYFGEQNRMK